MAILVWAGTKNSALVLFGQVRTHGGKTIWANCLVFSHHHTWELDVPSEVERKMRLLGHQINYVIYYWLPKHTYLIKYWENRENIQELRSWLSDSLGGRFFLAKSHADVQTGRISGMFSQAEFSPLFELSFYTHLGSSVASVSHLSLKFDLRHTRFIYTRQNITVASSHMSEYYAHYIFPGVMSHISICLSFFPPKMQ